MVAVKFSPLLNLLPFFLVASWTPVSLATNDTLPVYTDGGGHPVSSPYDYQRAVFSYLNWAVLLPVWQRGPLLLQDFHLVDLLSHFVRERIPERVVHAKGSGAHGYACLFEVTRDISNITMAAPFSEGVGTQVPLTMRFSTVAGESGTPDTNRDPRGFAIKMRTSQGIWDWVFNNTPVFFLRDPTKFPLFIHSQKRDPETNLRSPTNQWDYWSQNQESIYQVMILFSNRGTPRSWAEMHGWSGHTYKWVKADGTWHYVKVKVISNQGISNFNATEAKAMAANNPDYNTQELRHGDFPSWTVAIQTMTPEQGQNYKYDVNDLTKIWPEDEFPLLEGLAVGKIVLNKNPQNWFAEIEQLSFSPGNMVPGAEPSNDPVLQSRLFAYSDTARHRLGPNHLEIPINCPMAVNNFQRAGWMRVDRGAGTLPPNAPNYPSSFNPPVSFRPRPYNLSDIADPIVGPPTVLSSSQLARMDFEQPNALYNKEFTEVERQSLVANVIDALNLVTVPAVKQRSVDMFACVDKKLGQAIGAGINLTAKCAFDA
ncbi:Catalase domain-containing protein [Mycena sanguinolenta]|uniref:Catalase domain-containing protein n=1 Tax=Mycena sanguinolenta TaxID=230812 RepID=A0A8H6Z6F6_9AGAR|nr:Catalase domain-containing protein [Mycena sanguinolenta]